MVSAADVPQKVAPKFTKVDTLRPDTSGHNLVVKVKTIDLQRLKYMPSFAGIGRSEAIQLSTGSTIVKVAIFLFFQVLDSKIVLNREASGSGVPSKVAECLVGDETGCIVFTARNSQGKHFPLDQSTVQAYQAKPESLTLCFYWCSGYSEGWQLCHIEELQSGHVQRSNETGCQCLGQSGGSYRP